MLEVDYPRAAHPQRPRHGGGLHEVTGEAQLSEARQPVLHVQHEVNCAVKRKRRMARGERFSGVEQPILELVLGNVGMGGAGAVEVGDVLMRVGLRARHARLAQIVEVRPQPTDRVLADVGEELIGARPYHQVANDAINLEHKLCTSAKL